jgi:hypothetical protein
MRSAFWSFSAQLALCVFSKHLLSLSMPWRSTTFPPEQQDTCSSISGHVDSSGLLNSLKPVSLPSDGTSPTNRRRRSWSIRVLLWRAVPADCTGVIVSLGSLHTTESHLASGWIPSGAGSAEQRRGHRAPEACGFFLTLDNPLRKLANFPRIQTEHGPSSEATEFQLGVTEGRGRRSRGTRRAPRASALACQRVRKRGQRTSASA